MTVLPVSFENAVQVSGQMLRGAFADMQEGALDAGDMKVAPGAGLSVDVPAGVVLVKGDSIFDQGLYRCAMDATLNSAAFAGGGIAAAHATQPRIDQIIARVYDTDADGSGQRLWRPEVLAGAATAGATLANRTGAAALPASAMRLADILVPAAFGGPFVAATHIRDRRPWARGAFWRGFQDAGADYNFSSTSMFALDTTNLMKRIECSGVPLKITLMIGRCYNNTNQTEIEFNPSIDAVLQHARTCWLTNAFVGRGNNDYTWIFLPSAGSHLIGLYARVNGGQGTIERNTSMQLGFSIEEMVNQNVENTGA